MTALNRIGLGGVLTFNSRQAEAAMARTNRAFGGMAMKAGGFSSAARTAGTAAMGLTMIMLPLAMAVGSTIKQYTEFNKQMSAVQSVSGVTGDELESLRKEAIRLGGTTAFSATQAAEGLEVLGRAGFDVKQQIAATGAALNLAAADGISLAKAADFMATTLKGMGLEADQAGRVSDVLARASAKSNVNVTDLGQAFKLGSASLQQFNIEIEEGAAVFGALGNAGLKGTRGATSFGAMMNKLVKPTRKGAKFLKEFNIEMTKGGKSRKTADIMRDVSKGLASITDDGDRVKMAIELAGVRGSRAMNALMNAANRGDIGALEKQLISAKGAAQEMAEIRLNNLAGQFVMLKSAAETFVINFYDMFAGLDGGAIKPFVEGLQKINEAWIMMTDLISGDQAFSEVEENFGGTIAGIVFGIRDGALAIKEGINSVITKFSELGAKIEETLGADGVRKLTSFVVQFLAVSTALAPIIIIIGTIGIMFAAVMPLIGALGAAFLALLSPVGIAIGFIISRLFDFELGAGDFTRAITSMGEFVSGFVEGVTAGFYQLGPVFDVLNLAVDILLGTFKALANFLMGPSNDATTQATENGRLLGESIVAIGAAVFLYKSRLMALWLWETAITALHVICAGVTWALAAATTAAGTAATLAGGGMGAFALIMGGATTIVGALSTAFGVLWAAISGPIGIAVAAVAATVAMAALFDHVFDLSGGVAGLAAEFMGFNKELREFEAAYGKGVRVDAGDLLSGKLKSTQIAGASGDPNFISDGIDYGSSSEAPLESFETPESFTSGAIGDMTLAEEKKFELDINKEKKRNRARAKSKQPVEVNVDSKVCIDGKEVGRNQAKHQQDLSDRMGFNTPPFVRRTSAEQGTIPAR